MAQACCRPSHKNKVLSNDELSGALVKLQMGPTDMSGERTHGVIADWGTCRQVSAVGGSSLEGPLHLPGEQARGGGILPMGTDEEHMVRSWGKSCWPLQLRSVA